MEDLISVSLRSTLDCKSIVITSGYRCPEHDAAVSTGRGQHTKGTAADIFCYDKNGQAISSKLVCCKAQDLGFTGIANITSNYDCTHVDVRESGKWYGNEVYGNGNVTSDFYSYFGIQKEKVILAKGIDISYAQGKIDWDKVKAYGKAEFVLIRAGYGREISQIDSQFERNYRECKRLGIPVGAYWYSYATTVEEAKQEAAVCLRTIAGKTFEYPVAFDIEEQRSLANASELCIAFCSELEKAGYYAAIYSFKDAFENNISAAVKSKYDVFLSHVNIEKSNYAGSYGIWQYSWKGKIDGISVDVDLDYAYKNYPEIIKKAGLNGFEAENDSGNSNTPDDDKTEGAVNDKADTLEQILQHVANIDNKLS